MLISSYNQVLVAFSLIVAILASYTALDMAGRVTLAKGREALSWLIGGAFAMGFGIWSMHFVGMLAFSLPIPLGYDLGLTLLSLLLAVGSSAFALWLVCQAELPWQRLALGALLMGSGIAAMHYTGMAALLMMPGIVYDPLWLGLSILIAVIASGAALWIAFRLRHGSRRIVLVRAGAALVMGCAIVGMHYTGMAAAQFPLGSFCGAAGRGIDNGWLAVLVIVITLAVIAIALIVSVLDSRLEARTSVLATSLARANRELIQLALHDNLTKLPNRMLLDDRLEQAIQQAIRDDRRFAVLFMDLDGFKAVNDAYGHHLGDLLLIEVAERIRANVRAQDTIARLGGDEFVLLIEAREPADAAAYLDAVAGTATLPALRRPDRPLRTAWSATLGFADTAPAVAEVARTHLDALARAGALAVTDAVPCLPDPADCWVSLRHSGQDTAGTRAALLRSLGGLFAGHDLLATPTTPNPPHGHQGPGETMSVALTWAFNITGHPAISIPAGLTGVGEPVGLHLVAPPGREADLLAVALVARAMPTAPIRTWRRRLPGPGLGFVP